MLNKKRILSLMLASFMCTSTIPSFAYDLDTDGDSIENIEYHEVTNEDVIKGNYDETQVFAEIGSKYEVTIPKVIVLDGKEKTAGYYVRVNGDIAGYEVVYVIPDDSFMLYSKNKEEQESFVTQDKVAWSYKDFNEDANGNVKAPTITAGKWSGTFYFNLDLTEEMVLGDIILPDFIDMDDDYRLLLSKIQKEPGLYDENGELLVPYEDLIEKFNYDPSINYDADGMPIDTGIGHGDSTTTIIYDPETGLPTSTGSYYGGHIGTVSGSGSYSIKYIIENYYPTATYVSLPSDLKKIGSYGFAGTSISYIYIPDSVESIGNGAFKSTKIKLATIPKSVRYIGYNLYEDTPVTDVVYGQQKVVAYNKLPAQEIERKIESNEVIGIELEKGYKYQITALYNFYNDVTKESTIKSSNSNIVKFTPDCFLDAVDCGTATISGTYFTKDGRQKEATIQVTVVDGDSYGYKPSTKPKTNEIKTDTLVVSQTEQLNAEHVGNIGMKVGNETTVNVEFDGNDVSSSIKLISDNEKVAKIIKNKVYAVGEGETKVKIQYTFKKQISETEIRTITNEYYYTVEVKGFAARTVTNDYDDIAELGADYLKSNIGTYLDQKISIGGSVLTCDIYRVPDNTVLTSDVFLDCRAVDADSQVIVGKNLSVAAGTTLTPPYRCKGIFILDNGTFTNNGTISMTARGAKGAGVDIHLIDDYKIDAVGGAGGNSVVANVSGYSLSNGIAGQSGKSPANGSISCGGGGSGGASRSTEYGRSNNTYSGAGGSGTSFSGGAGGGGARANYGNVVGGTGSSTGGAGGDCGLATRGNTCYIAIGGTGNGNGNCRVDYPGYYIAKNNSGTGGLLVIMAQKVLSTGTLAAKGVDSIDINRGCGSIQVAGGGASGGGCICVIANDTQITGSTSVAGGNGSTYCANYYNNRITTNVNGGAGGAGTYKVVTVNKVF